HGTMRNWLYHSVGLSEWELLLDCQCIEYIELQPYVLWKFRAACHSDQRAGHGSSPKRFSGKLHRGQSTVQYRRLEDKPEQLHLPCDAGTIHVAADRGLQLPGHFHLE